MIHETVKIFPGAKLIGKVKIGQNSSIWYNAVLRGDIEEIKVGKFSNVQDNCVVHASKNHPILIDDYVSVGHAAVLHGCTIHANCIIGMNSTILNQVEIGKNSIVGAGAVVTEGKKFPARSLILGIPAKQVRELKEEEIKSIKDNALRYVELAKKSDYHGQSKKNCRRT
ncbi:MAG: gamma carbonic anhydrase family protein [Methanobacteriaceae archaeon]|jgi:carbonic anhydrase/acetyltransferase-like protein (isoleucine patch superfamily)|nr:MAG: gamma carbonic anhydrase family protein [Methanobacterium sp. BRmetb2]MCC7558485.1 gamma carbonic anhydrase family protein [Methanobacteriaceae archaeon]